MQNIPTGELQYEAIVDKRIVLGKHISDVTYPDKYQILIRRTWSEGDDTQEWMTVPQMAWDELKVGQKSKF